MVSATTPTTGSQPATSADAVDLKALQNRIVALEAEVSGLKDQIERLEIQAAIRRGEEEADKGLGSPIDEVDARLRKKYGIAKP